MAASLAGSMGWAVMQGAAGREHRLSREAKRPFGEEEAGPYSNLNAVILSRATSGGTMLQGGIANGRRMA